MKSEFGRLTCIVSDVEIFPLFSWAPIWAVLVRDRVDEFFGVVVYDVVAVVVKEDRTLVCAVSAMIFCLFIHLSGLKQQVLLRNGKMINFANRQTYPDSFHTPTTVSEFFFNMSSNGWAQFFFSPQALLSKKLFPFD